MSDGAVLAGVLERVTFANPETGYTIARIAPERGSGVGAEATARSSADCQDAALPDLLRYFPAAIGLALLVFALHRFSAGQTPSLPPAISLDLAAAGHVALASSEPGGELGEAGGEAR